jgi:hypothetical protein
MVLIGFPIGVLGQDEGIPVKLIFVEGGMTDALTAGPTGMPRGHNPGTRVRVKAILLDAKGNDVTDKCGGIGYSWHNPLSGEVVKVYPDAKGAELVIGAARGAARVTAWCKNYPKLKDHLLVTGNGGKGPFEPTEIRSWLENPPPPLRFSQSQRRYLQARAQKAPPPPVKRAPSGKPAGSGAGGAVLIGLLVGVVVLGAVALMSMSTEKCAEGKAPCGNYDVCCPDLWYYCPATNKCFRVMSGYQCPSGTVACHN